MTVTVAAFADERAPARRLAAALGARLAEIEVHEFPDGETMPLAAGPAGEVTVIYRSLDRPNGKLVELLLAADAWRRAGAKRLILVAPYFCYLRQDTVFAPGQPLSRDVIGPLIGRGFDGVVTVQAHLHRTQVLGEALGTQAVNLDAVNALAEALPPYDSPPLIVGPDGESREWVEGWAARLQGCAVALQKIRRGDRSVTVSATSPLPAQGRAVVIVDDVASSGRTLEQAVRLARVAGAATIDVAVAHALMDPAATRRLRRAGARRVISTDSVRHSTNAAHLAPLLAEAVRSLAGLL